MIIKLITHKRNKDGTTILFIDKGLTQEDRHILMDFENRLLKLEDYIGSEGTEYERGYAEGLKAGWETFYKAVQEVRENKPKAEAEDGCQK